MAGIRWNTLIRIVVGITQVMLGLIMIWFSKQFIDVTIRTGSDQDVITMVILLIALVVTGILLRQFYYYMATKANTYQSNSIRLRVFSSLFRRQMYEDQLHSGDVTSRLSKDIDTVSEVTTTLLPQFVVRVRGQQDVAKDDSKDAKGMAAFIVDSMWPAVFEADAAKCVRAVGNHAVGKSTEMERRHSGLVHVGSF